jgi:dTDP-4-dehydrorhamnose reductase
MALGEQVAREQPTVIDNAAAHAAAESLAVLATAAYQLHAYYSTDYVFAGNKPATYVEDDPTARLTVCAQTKLEGEQTIRASGCRHLILRTSWVYVARGTNFAKTMAALCGAQVSAAHGRRRNVPNAAADTTMGKTASCSTSWHGFAQFIITEAAHLGVPLRVTAENIHRITTAEYLIPVQRTANSMLKIKNCSRR